MRLTNYGFAIIIRSLLLVGAFVGLGIAFLCTADQSEELKNLSGEWVSLFDGTTTDHWKNPYEWGKIEIKENEIQLTANKKFFLVTKKNYGDFVFEGEILLPEGKANSGFMYRCHVAKNKVTGYQAEVDGSDRRWSGGLYDEGRRKWLWPGRDGTTNVPEKAKSKEEGIAHFAKQEVKNALKRNDWNKYQIVCQGNHLRVFVNGILITDVYDSMDAEGPIGIQHHGEKGQTYRFRNLRVKELK